jgi:hypothetical protein
MFIGRRSERRKLLYLYTHDSLACIDSQVPGCTKGDIYDSFFRIRTAIVYSHNYPFAVAYIGYFYQCTER